MNLSAVLRANSLTMGQAARILDVDKSTISKICSRTYHKWEEKEAELVDKLASLGYDKSASDSLSVNTNVLVKTRSVSLFFDLCDDLADSESSLSSSLGMAIGTAERGKTHASRWYASENENAAYTLYVDGFSRVQLLRNICCELAGVRPFGSCVSTVAEVSKVSRRLIIVDEADKCPVPLLEMLRGVNESCGVPVVLVGEERLKAKIDAVPRLRSRVRKHLCVFDPINPVDVAVYYSEALGVSLDKALAENLSRRAAGGFRTVANDSLALAKIARASGLSAITPAMLDRLG
jgi:DNA transposition AAA+ family ATPase